MKRSSHLPSSLASALASAVVLAAAAAACSANKNDIAAPAGDVLSTAPPAAEPPSYPAVVLQPEPQRAGDPAKGYRALVNEGYVPCGIPFTAFKLGFQSVPEDNMLTGREGKSAELPYNFNAMTTKEGVTLATSNCLSCHAAHLNGKLVVGLGATSSENSRGQADGDYSQPAEGIIQTTGYVGIPLSDPKEIAEWKKWKERIDTVAPYSVLSTRGPNPADGFTAVLFAHHDPKTLAWSSTPLMEVPAPVDVPVDVPPWWSMKKKTSMFYVGAGRGDHARIMMTASILCTSSLEESRAIDAYFTDIRAYIASIEAPKYPFPIDRALADRGRPVFEATCSRCHGTYGESGRYPNRLISTEEVGTDPVLASGAAQFAGPFVDWYKKSFFGEIARLEPQKGYVAPPLDGIWATAPYLHNGSVPTLSALLDSTTRPLYWRRSFASTDYDPTNVGWLFTPVDHNKAAETDETAKKEIYDTTRIGYANAGHTFGDALTPSDRSAVIEYLKTL